MSFKELHLVNCLKGDENIFLKGQYSFLPVLCAAKKTLLCIEQSSSNICKSSSVKTLVKYAPHHGNFESL